MTAIVRPYQPYLCCAHRAMFSRSMGTSGYYEGSVGSMPRSMEVTSNANRGLRQLNLSKTKLSSPGTPKVRLRRFLPIIPTAISPPETENKTAKPLTSGDVSSESFSEHASLPTARKRVTSFDTNEKLSMYSGPHVAEPCVHGALFHVLEPCGHRVMTPEPQLCGENCKDSGSLLTNAKGGKFACPVCISSFVQEHYYSKKALFTPVMNKLEGGLGGFDPSWREERLARMERIWKNDALEEHNALSKLGRRCEAICTEPTEEVWRPKGAAASVTPSLEKSSTNLSSLPEPKTARLKLPVPKTGPEALPRQSRLPAPSSTRYKKPMEEERPSKLPVGPRSSRK